MVTNQQQRTPPFPLVDAILVTPKESERGAIGICTNMSAPGQVLNEIEEQNRPFVSVLGSLVVNRDGTERMVLNCLAHPTIRYLVLFSEESRTFSPSTNLLLALQHGIDTTKPGNYIVGGKAATPHFPNLSKRIVDAFRETVTVTPLFMYQNTFTEPVLRDYLAWLRPRVGDEITEFLRKAAGEKAIYYDTLNQLVGLIGGLPPGGKNAIDLDPKEFQHLQPPVVEIPERKLNLAVPFRVSADGGNIRLDINVGGETFFIRGNEDFRMEYSLMKFLGARKKHLSPLEQLALGAELARADTEIKNDISLEPLATPSAIRPKSSFSFNVLLSVTTHPPTTSEWPPIYLVVLCKTKSAPRESGRWQ